jgi:Ca-activated chloride channel family protein
MSRKTSLLVLENDAMFGAFGIARTRGESSGEPEGAPASEPPPVGRFDGASGGAPKAGELGESGTGTIAVPFSLGAKGDTFGSGGLGLSGVGEGGGGRGGELGLGNIGTLGHGAGGIGTGQGFGAGDGRLGGAHRVKPPTVRMGATSVSGRLPPEVIQRIVRQNFGRMRLCYERGLNENPMLGGTVSVRFSISADGSIGAVSASGSMPDARVIACVAAAFRGMSFPAPEGGVVVVTYPIHFSSDASSPSGGWARASAAPAAAFVSADDRWMSDGASAITALSEAVQKDPERRGLRIALVRGLLARGRFDEAKTEAAKFVELDPDLASARDLLAQASVASGDLDGAAVALDSMVELSAGSPTAHKRAAIAFEVRGDTRRACAHWISAAELDRAAQTEAWRCRARSLGERAVVQDELTASGMTGDRASETLAKLADKAYAPVGPAFESLGVTASCGPSSAAACPSFATVDSAGNVVSPLVPDAFARAYPITNAGTYRTVLVGGDPAAKVKIVASVRGTTRTVELTRAERRTALTTQVAL